MSQPCYYTTPVNHAYVLLVIYDYDANDDDGDDMGGLTPFY